jgi:hypothetical protein
MPFVALVVNAREWPEREELSIFGQFLCSPTEEDFWGGYIRRVLKEDPLSQRGTEILGVYIPFFLQGTAPRSRSESSRLILSERTAADLIRKTCPRRWRPRYTAHDLKGMFIGHPEGQGRTLHTYLIEDSTLSTPLLSQ